VPSAVGEPKKTAQRPGQLELNPFEEKTMLSKSGMYAVNAMAVLANLDQAARVDVSSIAQEIHAPKMYLSKLMRRLSRAGLLNGRKGRGGGFRLSRNPDQISVFEVLEPFEHFDEGTNGKDDCAVTWDEPVPTAVHDWWKTIQFQYLRILHETSLADVAIDGLAFERQASADAKEARCRETG
jgi:Rrf2 family iron-sulfur cluster assembly transcriptional regulator